MKEAYWRPIANKIRKFKGHTRHFTQICPYCFTKSKNIILHYKTYHKSELERYQNMLSDSLYKGSLGIVNGVRFISTSK